MSSKSAEDYSGDAEYEGTLVCSFLEPVSYESAEDESDDVEYEGS